jgi:5-methylcytosine-specific restriction endonuclease McrA
MLAEPFSRHLCEHLAHSPKQITSRSSAFIETCQKFNTDEITKDELLGTTRKLGFNNVIDAFHVVNSGEIAQRFFIDERKTHNGIRLTDNFFKLAESNQFESFNHETEARWRLVEEAWRMGMSRNLISVEYDDEFKTLFTNGKNRRVTITSCRDSLNGYQKGHCFYCHAPISVDSNSPNLADVDHFIPWTLNEFIPNINGVWNLVLACKDCNRGEGGKFAKVPSHELLKRLHKRNEYFINSHLPLRETLIQQTGSNPQQRANFLQDQYRTAKQLAIHEWQPEIRGVITF